ncbi:MAG: hypothetical protein K6E10_09580 [Eubacterium sp.]|nr:hypothetical protein [Eubacterium sp.]
MRYILICFNRINNKIYKFNKSIDQHRRGALKKSLYMMILICAMFYAIGVCPKHTNKDVLNSNILNSSILNSNILNSNILNNNSIKCVLAESLYKPVDALISFECGEMFGDKPYDYKIKIKTQDSITPMPQDDTVTVDGRGKGSFRIKITEPGTYVYRVYEEIGSDSEVIYDNTEYDVYVYVINNENNELTYSVSVNYADTDEKPSTLYFNNDSSKKNKVPENSYTESSTEAKTEDTANASGSTELTTENSASSGMKTDSGAGENSKDKAHVTNTGDSMDLSIVISILILSFISILLVSLVKRKEGKK